MKRKVLVELWAHGGQFEIDFDKWEILTFMPAGTNILVVLVSKDGPGK